MTENAEPILVTGADGFVGGIVASALAQLPGARLVFGNRAETDAPNRTEASTVADLFGAAPVVPVEWRDGFAALRNALAAWKPREIWNCTGALSHDPANYAETFALNAALPALLADAVEDGGRLHHVSTVGVFGPDAPATDHWPEAPASQPPLHSPYTLSKHLGELEVLRRLERYKGAAASIIRLPNVIGLPDEGIRWNTNGYYSFMRMLQAARRGNRDVLLGANPEGRPTLIRASTLQRLVRRLSTAKAHGVVILNAIENGDLRARDHAAIWDRALSESGRGRIRIGRPNDAFNIRLNSVNASNIAFLSSPATFETQAFRAVLPEEAGAIDDAYIGEFTRKWLYHDARTI